MNNYYLGGKCLIIILFIGIFISSSSCDKDDCGGDETCVQNCLSQPPCKDVRCPEGQICQIEKGRGVCRHVCYNVTCPLNTWCYSVNPKNCQGPEANIQGPACLPYAECRNPCDNYCCPDGKKCSLQNGFCVDMHSPCPVPECKYPCEDIKCGPYKSCFVKEGQPTCQNPCNYKKCCDDEICCAKSNGQAECRKSE